MFLFSYMSHTINDIRTVLSNDSRVTNDKISDVHILQLIQVIKTSHIQDDYVIFRAIAEMGYAQMEYKSETDRLLISLQDKIKEYNL